MRTAAPVRSGIYAGLYARFVQGERPVPVHQTITSERQPIDNHRTSERLLGHCTRVTKQILSAPNGPASHKTSEGPLSLSG
jgi:hypothetical protein